jgi:hypothetical protein
MERPRHIATFRSAQFSPFLPDECQVNPGVFGAELAFWLCADLARRGFVTSYPAQDDWCWTLEFLPESGSEFSICCSNIDAASDRWQLALIRQPRKMFGRDKPSFSEVSDLMEAVRASIASVADASEVDWLYDRSVDV